MAVFGAPVAHGDDPEPCESPRRCRLWIGSRRSTATLSGARRDRDGRGCSARPGGAATCGSPARAVNAAARLQAGGIARRGSRRGRRNRPRACRAPPSSERKRPRRRERAMDNPLTAFRARRRLPTRTKLTDVPLIGFARTTSRCFRLIARRAAREEVPQLRHRDRARREIGKTRLGRRAVRGPCAVRAGARVVGRRPALRKTGSPSGRSAENPARRGRSWAREARANEGSRQAARGRVPGGGRRLTMPPQLGRGPRRSRCAGAEEGTDAEDELKRAWRRFVALLVADRPLAIGVDDAHWGRTRAHSIFWKRPPSAFTRRQWSFLCNLAGPNWAETAARTSGRASAKTTRRLELAAAGRPPSATRLAELLLPGGPAGGSRGRIAGRPPAAIRSSPKEVSRGDPGGASRRRSRSACPDTVQAAIAARIDQLPFRGEKRGLHYAAVLGHNLLRRALWGTCSVRDPGPTCSWSLRRKALVRGSERTFKERKAATPSAIS